MEFIGEEAEVRFGEEAGIPCSLVWRGKISHVEAHELQMRGTEEDDPSALCEEPMNLRCT